jgi:hypothetical protein
MVETFHRPRLSLFLSVGKQIEFESSWIAPRFKMQDPITYFGIPLLIIIFVAVSKSLGSTENTNCLLKTLVAF